MHKKFEPQSLKLLLFLCFFSQLGAETGVQSSDLHWMRNVMRLIPLAVLPITVHFPSVSNDLGASFKSFLLAQPPPSRLLRVAASKCLLFLSIQAVFVYWFSSNMFSLVQVSCLRIPAVRTILKIPQRVVHDPDKLPPREGFIKSFKRGKGLSSESGPGESGLKVGMRPNCLILYRLEEC